MDFTTSLRRPSLISRQPDRLVAALRVYGICPRLLSLQIPYAHPESGVWGILPLVPSPLLLDCSDLAPAEAAMVLTDLRIQQRQHQVLPLLLVPPAVLCVQRLIATSGLTGVVISADAAAATIARWVNAPARLGPGLVWVELLAPPLMEKDPHLVPLLAALSHASSMAQAAEWCALSCRKVNYVLATSCRQLGIPIAAWRSPAQWVDALSNALASPGPTIQHLLSSAGESQCEGQQKDSKRNARMNDDVLMASLCGCVVLRIVTEGRTVRLELDDPRLGRFQLQCKDAAILTPTATWAHFDQRAAWARVIDWADRGPDQTLQLSFANGADLVIKAAACRLERLSG